MKNLYPLWKQISPLPNNQIPESSGLFPSTRLMGKPVTAPPLTASATIPAPTATLKAPSSGAPTYLATLRSNSTLSRAAASSSPSLSSASWPWRYVSYFSLSLLRPYGITAEWNSQLPAPPEPSITASSDENAAPALVPADRASDTTAAFPGLFLTHSAPDLIAAMTDDGSLAAEVPARAALEALL